MRTAKEDAAGRKESGREKKSLQRNSVNWKKRNGRETIRSGEGEKGEKE